MAPPIPTTWTQAPVETTSTPPINPPGLSQEYIHRAAWKAGVIGAFNFVAKVLAARFIVLVSIVGGIMLALPTLSQPDWFKVGILAVYCAGVILPAVVLEVLGRR